MQRKVFWLGTYVLKMFSKSNFKGGWGKETANISAVNKDIALEIERHLVIRPDMCVSKCWSIPLTPLPTASSYNQVPLGTPIFWAPGVTFQKFEIFRNFQPLEGTSPWVGGVSNLQMYPLGGENASRTRTRTGRGFWWRVFSQVLEVSRLPPCRVGET